MTSRSCATIADPSVRGCNRNEHVNTLSQNSFLFHIAVKGLFSQIEYTFATNGKAYEPYLITTDLDGNEEYSRLPLDIQNNTNFAYIHNDVFYIGKAETVCEGRHNCDKMNYPNTKSVTKITISFDDLNLSKIAIDDMDKDGNITLFDLTLTFKNDFSKVVQLDQFDGNTVIMQDICTVITCNILVIDLKKKIDILNFIFNEYRRFAIYDSRGGKHKRIDYDLPFSSCNDLPSCVSVLRKRAQDYINNGF